MREKTYRWHTPDEIPTKQRSIVILLYKNRRYDIDYGFYIDHTQTNSNGEVEHYTYVEEYDNRRMWKNVTKWCYDYEFDKLIRKTFDNRQRKFHLRNKLNNK